MIQAACLVLGPLVLVLGTAFLCKMPKDAGRLVSFRPPAYFFSVVWPVLLLLLGYSLYEASNRVPHVLLTVLLMAWLPLYARRMYKEALWLLVVQLFLAFLILSQATQAQALAGSALAAWLVFALLMSAGEMQERAAAACWTSNFLP